VSDFVRQLSFRERPSRDSASDFCSENCVNAAGIRHDGVRSFVVAVWRAKAAESAV
jgi:hypothetical protein